MTRLEGDFDEGVGGVVEACSVCDSPGFSVCEDTDLGEVSVCDKTGRGESILEIVSAGVTASADFSEAIEGGADANSIFFLSLLLKKSCC